MRLRHDGQARRVIILGAAGRDFHNFNVAFRGNPRYRVVAFTAAQIPDIADRRYPPALAGAGYPDGIAVHPECELAGLIARHDVDDVVFSYSDVSHQHVMHLASVAWAGGASFHLLGPADTMLESPLPVIAVVAARTGAGKSTVTRYLHRALAAAGRKPAVIRHPMPYGRLDRGVECYGSVRDLAEAGLTIEEMEEYQPHVDAGAAVYAGVDYEAVLAAAVPQADLVLWDGGNNDMAFYRPTVTVTVLDPLRPGEEDRYFPGEANVRAADVLVISKVNAARAEQVEMTQAKARELNPRAPMVQMELAESVDRPELVAGRRVLLVEDGPSVTHGGLPEAAAARAARLLGATAVDPRPHAVGSIAAAYVQYPHMGPVLPALGYSAAQREDLRRSIANVPCAAVLLGTPADLTRLLGLTAPVARVSIAARDRSQPSLAEIVRELLERRSNGAPPPAEMTRGG
jgi:predicted GTPase